MSPLSYRCLSARRSRKCVINLQGGWGGVDVHAGQRGWGGYCVLQLVYTEGWKIFSSNQLANRNHPLYSYQVPALRTNHSRILFPYKTHHLSWIWIYDGAHERFTYYYTSFPLANLNGIRVAAALIFGVSNACGFNGKTIKSLRIVDGPINHHKRIASGE